MILEIQRNGVQLHVFNLKETDVVLGRGAECDCPINAEDISRMHCRIKFENDKYYIQDLKSANGTFVYDERIGPGEFHELLPEFPIKIGKSVLIYVRDIMPAQEMEEYNAPPVWKVDDKAKTQVFTGLIKKGALKEKPKAPKANSVIMLVPLVIIGVIVTYYFLFYNSASVAPTVAKQPAPAIPVEAKPVSTNPVVQQMPKSGCLYDDEKAICSALSLSTGDYVSFKDGEVSIVINLGRWVDAKYANTGNVPEEEKKRLILIQLLNMVHANLEAANFSSPPTKLRVFGATGDYLDLNTVMSMPITPTPTPAEIAEAIDAAVSTGMMAEFEVKFGQLFKNEEVK